MSKGNSLISTERDREDAVRTVACPVCEATPLRRCTYGITKDGRTAVSAVSHDGRYRAAVAAGLVPAYVGETS